MANITPGQLYHSIENAARVVESQIFRDNSFPDLKDLLGTTSHVSGDYTPIRSPILKKEAVIPLPPSLVQLYSQTLEYKTFMGILPEIKRVWMTVDTDLYLWDYMDGNKFYTHHCNQIVVGVALVKPLPGVWSNPPDWVLVVATITQVMLLTVNIKDGELQISETDLVAAVDGVGMMCIASNSEGRVFLGGFNGNLYELFYSDQGPLSLVFSRCRLTNVDMGLMGATLKQFSPSFASWWYTKPAIIKVVVDSERGILYTLARDSIISVYDIFSARGECRLIARYEVNKFVKTFMQLTDNTNVNVTNIFVINEQESKYIHLVAVTDDATRLYFTTADPNTPLAPASGINRPPFGLHLVHAKRPGTQPWQAGCSNVSVATYWQGMFVYADPRQEGKDVIVACAPDYSVIHTNLRSGNAFLPNAPAGAPATTPFPTTGYAPPGYAPVGYAPPAPVPTTAISLTENSSPFNAQVTVLGMTPLADQKEIALSPLNLLVRQHLTPSPHFVCVSSRGLFTMSYVRPLDELYALLAGKREAEINEFFARYKYNQACAMALHIAVLGLPSIQEPAKFIFFKFAGKPQLQGGQQTPLLTQPTLMGSTLVAQTFINSPGYEGVVTLLAAFFNSFWSRSLCQEEKYNPKSHTQFSKEPLPQLVQAGVAKPVKIPDLVVVSRFDSRVLEEMTVFLKSLLGFFQRNPSFVPPEIPPSPIMPVNLYTARPSAPRELEAYAQHREQQALYELSLFVARAADACNFLLIISPFFPTLTPDMPADVRKFLLERTLRDLSCAQIGGDVAQSLAGMLMAYASNRGMDVANLSNSLLASCPTFFSRLERTKANADDLLNKAILTGSPNGYEPSPQALEYLQPALQLYESIVPKFDLGEIPDNFIKLGFYPGVLQLCFAYADALDPANRALKYYYADPARKANDTEGERLYNERRTCYAHILKVFDRLKSSNDVIMTPEEQMQEELAADVKHMIFHHAINSKDELFHHELYNWYFLRGKGQEVVLMDTPFVERYLEKNHRDALAQYYIRLQRFDAAAELLAEQAEKPNVNINDRVADLARAINAVNACDNADTEFARELQDKLDVALVQQRIYDLLPPASPLRPALDEGLLNLEQLYNLARENGLTEVQLLVLSAANHKDEQRVASLWDEVVKETYHATSDLRAVSAKVVSLISSMATKTNDYIPLGLLLDSLERIAIISQQQDVTQVFQNLMGTLPQTEPLNLWLEYFDLLKKPFWTDPQNRLHLYKVLTELLACWQRSSLPIIRERSIYASLGMDAKIDDVITGLSMLATPEATEYRERLRELRNEIFPQQQRRIL